MRSDRFVCRRRANTSSCVYTTHTHANKHSTTQLQRKGRASHATATRPCVVKFRGLRNAAVAIFDPPPRYSRAPRRFARPTRAREHEQTQTSQQEQSKHVHVNMREKDTLLAGLLTVCAVSTAALFRLVAVFRIFRQQRRRSSTNGSLLLDQHQTTDDRVASSRVLVPSLVFHVMVFLCLVVEVPVYAWRWLSASGIANFVQEGRQLYALHMTSYLLLYMAFSVVITLWSDVAVFEPNEWTALMNRWGSWQKLRRDRIVLACTHLV